MLIPTDICLQTEFSRAPNFARSQRNLAAGLFLEFLIDCCGENASKLIKLRGEYPELEHTICIRGGSDGKWGVQRTLPLDA